MKVNRVLVVEDCPEVRSLVTTVLSTIPSCEVIGTSNGGEALDLVSKQVPDLIITDLDLPGIDGIELIRRLRATPFMCHAPLIVITGGLRGAEALAAGCYTVIQKPFSVHHLLSVVNSLL